MAEDDLIFAIEGVGNGNRDLREDSDDDEQYLICPITDYDDHKPNKICNHNFMKNNFCETSSSPRKSSFNVKEAWRHALEKAKHIPDPWAEFHLEEIETESATRYRYNAISGKWVEDEVFMKMAQQPFGRGAMRECYRTKKLSNFTRHQQWKSASNYVAKRYIDSVDRNVYFEDVRLQMEAKLWGEEYNRHKPPKQVDIMQMCILEMKDRPGKPLYHLEHYIEGKYIKYNSNSGFVRDENFRLTPQKTAKTVIRGTEEVCGSTRVRTISGSRPPILTRLSETSADESMSDSNFDSLPCSPSSWWSFKEDMLGKSPMGWTFFNEVDNLGDEHSDSSAERRMSENGGDSGCPSERRGELEGEFADRMNANMRKYCESDEDSIRRENANPNVCQHLIVLRRCHRTQPDHHNEDKWNQYHTSRAHMHRPSCVAFEVERLNAITQEKKIGKSILGKVHLAMVRYHEAGRFCDKLEEWDRKSAIFHLEHAALCGELEAIVALGLIYLQLPHHILTDVTVEDTQQNRQRGFDYLLMGAEAGDRPSMILVARAFDSGINLSPNRTRDWKEALHWYTAALNMTDYDEGGEYDGTGDEPKYCLLARKAEMHMTGGFGMEPDPQTAGDLFTEAADAAMADMKGRLANQYYERAEEAWGMMEE
ncbi:eukaryotic elongation factor 2 kinase isoform X6 [Mustelus asterias]